MHFSDSATQIQLELLKPQIATLQQKLKALAEFAQDTEIDPTRYDGTMELGTIVALFHATQKVGSDLPSIIGSAFDVLNDIEAKIDSLPWWSDVVLKIFFSPWTIDESVDAILAILEACRLSMAPVREALSATKLFVAQQAAPITAIIESYLVLNKRSGALHGTDCIDASSIGGSSCAAYKEMYYGRCASDYVKVQHAGRDVCVARKDLCNQPNTDYAFGQCVSTKGQILENSAGTRWHNFTADELHLLDKARWEAKKNECKYLFDGWTPGKYCVKTGGLPFVSGTVQANGLRVGAFFNESKQELILKEYQIKSLGEVIADTAEDVYDIVTEYGCAIVNDPLIVGGAAALLSITASPATGALVITGAQAGSTACAAIKVAEALYLILKLVAMDHRQPTWKPIGVDRIERLKEKLTHIQLPPPVRKPKVSAGMLAAFKVPRYAPGTYAVLFESKYYIMSPTAALPRKMNVATGIVASTAAAAAAAATPTTPTTPTYPTSTAPAPKPLALKASGLGGITPEDIKNAQPFTPSDHTLIDVLDSVPAGMEVRTPATPSKSKTWIFVSVGAVVLVGGFVTYQVVKRRRR